MKTDPVKTIRNVKPRKARSSLKAPRKRRSAWYVFGQWCLWILTVFSIAGLLLASFGGCFSPEEIKGIPLMLLTFPAWIVIFLIVSAMDALWCRKALVFCILTFIACANAIWDYCPLNIFGPSEKKYAGCPKLTLLTYNIASYRDLTGEYPGDVNPTLSYIIKVNADVVCLQETDVLLSSAYPRYHITDRQIDTLKRMYPYDLNYGGYLTVLSKYPVEPIHTPRVGKDPKNKWSYYPISVFRLNIEGLPVTLFNVHLRSYQLTADDKKLYREISNGNEVADVADGEMKKDLYEIRYQLIRKVQQSAEKRAVEADLLGNYIEKFGGPNVIVAGDFNDVPGCYTLRKLAGYGMKQVYPKIGFGPMITFNADNFYFRIDHILYRGAFVPLKIARGSLRCSDHYPLVCTFALTGTSDNEKEQ